MTLTRNALALAEDCRHEAQQLAEKYDARGDYARRDAAVSERDRYDDLLYRISVRLMKMSGWQQG